MSSNGETTAVLINLANRVERVEDEISEIKVRMNVLDDIRLTVTKQEEQGRMVAYFVTKVLPAVATILAAIFTAVVYLIVHVR